ncbi:hypothetical protein D3C84_503110 [compost metagenome]
MVGQHALHAGVGRRQPGCVAAGIVLVRAYGIDHPLPAVVGEELVGREDVAFHVAVTASGAEVAVIATHQREVGAPVVAELQVVDAAASTGQIDHIRVQPVDVEGIPVVALARPQGGIFQHGVALERRYMVEGGIHLAHVQAAFCGRPVIGGFHPVGDRNGDFGAGAVLCMQLFRQIDTHVGIVFVAEPPDGAANRTGRRNIGAATPAAQPFADQQPGAGIAIEAEAVGELAGVLPIAAAGLFQGLLASFDFCQASVQDGRRCLRRGGKIGAASLEPLQLQGDGLGLPFGR